MKYCQDGNFIPLGGGKQAEESGSIRLGPPRCFSNGFLIQMSIQEHLEPQNSLNNG